MPKAHIFSAKWRKTVRLFQNRTKVFKRARLEIGCGNRTSTGIPSKKRFIIAGRPEPLGFFIEPHGFPKEIVRREI